MCERGTDAGIRAMDFQIYTMYVNRQDLLEHAIESVGRYRDRVVVIDNSPERRLELEHFRGEIIRPPVPLFVSQSYNLIRSFAEERRQEGFFMMHSDAEASEDVVEQLLERAKELDRTRVNWGVILTNYDVFCLLNTRIVKEFPWDTYLPVYYTDVDFYYRLRLAGVRLVETDLPVKHMEQGSNAMKADPTLRQFITSNYPAWRQYYIAKWGGERDQERYSTPFNRRLL